MYKDDETRRVLYEVLLDQCFRKMSEEEKVEWIRRRASDDLERLQANSRIVSKV